jgi:hypothetical protein
VVNDDASEQSQSTASATSSTVASRPMGWRLVIAAPISASWKNARSVSSVRTMPGQTALMRMLCAAYSMAAARVAPMTPCLLAP